MGLSGSAVCVFENLEIDKAFDGPFKEQTASTSFWMPVPDNRVPSPRPGRVSEQAVMLITYESKLFMTFFLIITCQVNLLNIQTNIYYVHGWFGIIKKLYAPNI